MACEFCFDGATPGRMSKQWTLSPSPSPSLQVPPTCPPGSPLPLLQPAGGGVCGPQTVGPNLVTSHLVKLWSFSFSIRASYGYSGLVSFRIDGFDLLAVQGTLKSLLQHRSSKASGWGTHVYLWRIHFDVRQNQYNVVKLKNKIKFKKERKKKSINPLALSFLYSPTLTSIHDHWEKHSFNNRDLCQQSDISAF